MRRTWVVWAMLAACSQGAALEATTTTSTTTTTTTTSTTTTTLPPTTTTTTLPPSSGLNGLPAEDPALLDRRVMAVKIDNHWNARPQSGLQEADAVYELLVEGGLTRFIALFHDNDTSFLGPVRSGRPTDPTLLRPLGATFAISGAQDWVIGRIVGSGVPLLGEGSGMYRVRWRRAPHNLYAETTALRATADRRGFSNSPPSDLFSWGEIDTPSPYRTAREIHFGWSRGYAVRWVWDGTVYRRFHGSSPHRWIGPDDTSGQVSADTLVVLFAPRYTASGGSGSPVPAMDTVGQGAALVFSRGLVLEGNWARDSMEEHFRLTDAAGEILVLPRGVPWISIFPAGNSVSW